MKNVMIVGLFVVVSAASAQTNTQESCQRVYARVSAQREAEFKDSNAAALTQYGKALESIKAAYKQKGDIDSYSIVDAESKRFEVTKVVSVDSPSLQYAEAVGFYRKQIQDNKASYEVKKVALLKQYVGALQGQIKDLMASGKMDEAKVVADSKKTAEFELAEMEVRQSSSPIIPVESKKYPSVAGTWKETRPDFDASGAEYKITQTGNKIKCKGVFPKPYNAIFDGEGTISPSGEIVLRVRFTKAPSNWLDSNTVMGQLSEDNLKVNGQTTWATGKCKIIWHRKED